MDEWSLQQEKQRLELQREQQRERELERERLLAAKPVMPAPTEQVPVAKPVASQPSKPTDTDS